MMEITRTHNIEDITENLVGNEVIIGGWVEDFRKLGKMAFLTIRDVSGLAQIIVKDEMLSMIDGLNRQSVVRISGLVQDTKARDFKVEEIF